MKKIILIFATLLYISISAQQQQTIYGNVRNAYFPFGVGNTGFTVGTSPAKVVTFPTAANSILSGQNAFFYDNVFVISKTSAGTGSLLSGLSIGTRAKNFNIGADTSHGYSTNIVYRGKNSMKTAFSVTSTTATSTSTLNLMSDSGLVAIGYKLRASKLPLNDSSGLSAGDFYISGNTIKVKR